MRSQDEPVGHLASPFTSKFQPFLEASNLCVIKAFPVFLFENIFPNDKQIWRLWNKFTISPVVNYMFYIIIF